MSRSVHDDSSPFDKLPELGRLLQFFEEEEARHGDRDLETAISSKSLTRTSFFQEARWAILVSGFKAEVASSINHKALECGFPSDWQVLGEWGDDEFNAWCKSMAAELNPPRDDLTGKFRDKWWAIWDLAWYLLQFDSEATFQDHFFDGKSEGYALTDEDVQRLKKIKDEEGRLYMIGEANRYFVLRNLGGDFLKPDVWIQAFSQWYGDVTVSELARMLKDQGIRCGRFDAYCWSYCEREIQEVARLPAHLDELFTDGEISPDAFYDDGNASVLSFEESVWLVEKLRIVIRDRGSSRIGSYPYKRPANLDWTLAQLVVKRIRGLAKDREVTCIGGDGRPPNGRTLLRNVRASYED